MDGLNHCREQYQARTATSYLWLGSQVAGILSRKRGLGEVLIVYRLLVGPETGCRLVRRPTRNHFWQLETRRIPKTSKCLH